jgi:teichuronic acid biosynthesis glycosyltransferase TuaC
MWACTPSTAFTLQTPTDRATYCLRRGFEHVDDPRAVLKEMARVIRAGRSVMQPLRVLVFSTVFPSPVHPTHGLFVWQRIRPLARQAELHVVAPVSIWRSPTRLPTREEDGVIIHHPRFVYVPLVLKCLDGVSLFVSSVATIVRLRREFRFDLIDAHFSFPDGFAAVLLGLCFRCPVVITERGTLIPLSRYRVRRWMANWALRRASRVIAVASPLARRVIEAGLPADRVTIIGNGVDSERFHPGDRSAARARFGIPAETRLLVSVGHLSRRKGFDRVLRAFAALAGTRPELRLAIIGGPGLEGDEQRPLTTLARDLGVSDRVMFTGAKPPDVVAAWLAASDLFVFASDYEGSPNVLWEALATGRPVVTGDVGDASRIVPPHGGIVYDDPHDIDQLTRAIVDALDRQWNESEIRSYVEQNTWDAVAVRVVDQWRRAITPSQSAA